MSSRLKKTLQTLLAGLLLAIVAVLVGLVPINISGFSNAITESVQQATGLKLSLDGPVVVRLGPRASLSAADLAVATPEGASLLELDTVKLRVSLFALTRQRIHVHSADLAGLRADLCRLAPERPAQSSSADRQPYQLAIDDLHIRSVSLACAGEAAAVRIDEVEFAAPADAPMRLNLAAALDETTVSLAASGESLDTLLRGGPFGIQALLELADARLSAEGVLDRASGHPTFDGRVGLSVADLSMLGDAFGLALPEVGAIDVGGKVRGDLADIGFGDVAGVVGQTVFATAGSLNLAGERPAVALDMSIEHLDLEPFLADTEASSDEEFDLGPALDMLQGFDANLAARANSVSGIPLDLRSVVLQGSLAEGIVELQSAEADVLDGRLSLTGRLDANPDCPPLELEGTFESLDIEALREMGWLDAPVGGQLERIELTAASCGTQLPLLVEGLTAAVTASGGNLIVAGETAISVTSFEMSTAPGEALQSSATAQMAGESIRASATSNSLQAMLGADNWPVRLDAQAGGSTLSVGGEIHVGDGPPRVKARTEFRAPSVGNLHFLLGISPDAELPLLATSRFVIDGTRIRADDISIEIGGSDIAGNASWRYAESPDTLTLELRSSYVDLDELGSLFEAAGPPDRPAATPSPPQRLPPIDLDLFFAAVRDGPLDVEDLAINGRMRAGLIDNARVSALVEDELELEGEIEIDARELPAAINLDVVADQANLGRLLGKLEIADGLAMRAGHIRLRAESEGASVGEILKNTNVLADVTGFEWDIPRTQSEEDFALRLKTMTVAMLPGQPLGASTYGTIDGESVELFVEVPGLGAVLAETNTLPLRLTAALGADVAIVDVELDRSVDDVVKGFIELSGQKIAADGRDLSELSPPLTDYALRGDLEIGGRNLSLSNIEAELGGSTASGSASITRDDRPRVFLDIASPEMQATDWQFLPSFIRDNDDAGTEAVIQPDTPPGQAETSEPGPLVAINDLLLRYQEQYDLDLRVAIDELYAGPDYVGGVEAELFIDENDLRLEPVTIRLPGGGLDAAYSWRLVDGRVDAELAARADGLVFGGLLKLIDPASRVSGVVYVDVDFTANANWSADVTEFDLLLSNADGRMDIAAWPEDFEAGFLDLWTANLVFALLPTPTAGDTSRLNCVVARLAAEEGVLKTKNTLVDSTRTIVRGRGQIDLARGEIDLLVTPQAKRERFLSASTPVRITGPLNDFDVGVQPAGFIGTLIRWYTNLIYVPFKWLTGQRFPPDGTQTCFDMMDWELTPAVEAYFRERDFSAPPPYRLFP